MTSMRPVRPAESGTATDRIRYAHTLATSVIQHFGHDGAAAEPPVLILTSAPTDLTTLVADTAGIAVIRV